MRNATLSIYDYTGETFGAYQTEAYHVGPERTLDLIANFARIRTCATCLKSR